MKEKLKQLSISDLKALFDFYNQKLDHSPDWPEPGLYNNYTNTISLIYDELNNRCNKLIE